MLLKRKQDASRVVALTDTNLAEAYKYVTYLVANFRQRVFANPNISPQDFFDAYGPHGGTFLDVVHRAVSGANEIATLTGKPQIGGLLPAAWTSKKNADGSITLTEPPKPTPAPAPTAPNDPGPSAVTAHPAGIAPTVTHPAATGSAIGGSADRRSAEPSAPSK